jgi:DNA-binding helix-hairpin-helix protein with protein kinase domain
MIHNLSGLIERLVWRVFKGQHLLDQALQIYQADTLEKSLREIRIQDSRIPGIGPTVKKHLADLGITRAIDISSARLLQVEGLGVSAIRDLLAWRRAEEQVLRATMPRQLPGLSKM